MEIYLKKNQYLDDGKLDQREELRSFGEDMKHFLDVILKVEDRKFYVSKLYLSSQSPYFATLFFGEFQESGKPEIELKDVDPQDLEKVKVISSGHQKTARRATKTGDHSSSTESPPNTVSTNVLPAPGAEATPGEANREAPAHQEVSPLPGHTIQQFVKLL
ncbi:unnamed protein product [Caenorhabditis nigoni]